ncbi:MAG TPA: hypothetical protein VI790_04790 [Candidatus Nanoarchaeia archaeon]|nr:hypothetical protein [Candidatus Nanoarchaeia archaeon]
MCLSSVGFESLKFMGKPDSFFLELSEVINFYVRRLLNGANLSIQYKRLVRDLGSFGVSLSAPADLEAMIGCLSLNDVPYASITNYVINNLSDGYISTKLKSLLV